jgi:DNA-binding transcriptional LysR family regulator
VIVDARLDAVGAAPAHVVSAGRLFRLGQWPGIEFRHLAALEAVAEEASFNRAASRLGYTQSAISQQIAALERAVGHLLIDRRGGSVPVVLTPAGRLLMHHAGAIGSHLVAAHADLSALASGSTGVVRVGTFQTLGATVLPQILRSLVQRAPGVDVDLVELPSDIIVLELLARGDLDVALAHLPLPPGPFGAEAVIHDDYVLVTRCGTPLAKRVARMTMQEIVEVPLIGFRSCRCCDPAVSHLRSLGLEPKYAFQVDSVQTMLGLVADGLGAAIVPRLAVDGHDGRVEVCELDRFALPFRVVAVVWHCDRVETNASAGFRAAARSAGARQERAHGDLEKPVVKRMPA